MGQAQTIAVIPARGDSKGIVGKNIALLDGKPLLYWTCKAASECPLIDKTYVSTDDVDIANVVMELSLPKVTVFHRTPETATDEASSELPLIEVAKKFKCDYIALIQATSPLLTAGDLRHGFEKLVCYDSVISVVEFKRFVWRKTKDGVMPFNYDPQKRPRRQDMHETYVENGAFYITSRKALLESGCRINGTVGTVVMDPASYYEIDEQRDFEIVATLKKELHHGRQTSLSSHQ